MYMGNGAEIVAYNDDKLYTYLDEYNRNKRNAVPVLILSTFDEFCVAKSKVVSRYWIAEGYNKGCN